ncbi:MAG: glycosyl transferase [Anaerolineae bacterium SM23_84]|nr:MAG: glycosyl transferase [Anaerolineae bacterium SM23_84]
MAPYMLILASALIIVVGSMPLVKWAAVRWGFMDEPSARKVHARPTPRLGGAAIYLGCIAALLVFSDRFYVSQLVSILVGATLVSFLGVWDDRQGLRPLLKLIGQGLAAGILIVSGIEVGFLHNAVLNLAATLLWVVGITNALNLLDNMDGLSGGVATVACIFFFLLAVMSGQYLVGSLAAALLGACLGFLYYNLNPASIFMGDTGSLFIGFVLAALGIKLRFPDNVDFVTWMIPLVVLGLPIFDTALVVISRLRRGRNPLTTPGKDHVSHRLVAMGATQREAVLLLYLAGCALGVVAMFLTQASVVEGYFVGGLLIIFALCALWRLEQVKLEA